MNRKKFKVFKTKDLSTGQQVWMVHYGDDYSYLTRFRCTSWEMAMRLINTQISNPVSRSRQ